MNLQSIDLIILDVDGVLTDGSVTASADGESGQTVSVQDGMAVTLWQRAGGLTSILSGRPNEHVAKRARELGVEHIMTGVKDKAAGLTELLRSTGREAANAAYVGDDLPDLPAMATCGFPVAVANAMPAVKRAAAYVTRRSGGAGAVAEVVEYLLRKKDRWSTLAASFR